MKLRLITLITSLIMMIPNLVSASENNVPYPQNYRSWAHIKTMLIEPGHPLANPFQGIHHVYARQKAYQGLKSGNYSDGAVLVFDLIDYLQKDKAIQEGSRKLVGIMHKDAKKYAQTGGWGFEGFAANSKTERLVKDGGRSCFGCHAPEKANDFVFSKLRD